MTAVDQLVNLGGRSICRWMNPVKPPRSNVDYPDRFLDCQEALETLMQEILDRAVASGWLYEEAGCAMVEVAEELMIAAIAKRQSEQRH